MLRETLNVLLLLMLCGPLGIAGAFAAEPPEPDAEEQAQSDEDAETAEADADKDGDAVPSREIFIPTEEISEDFAVSFPVDI